MFLTRRLLASPGHHSPLDPAFARIQEISQNRYKYFRWTARTGRLFTTYVVIIPGIIGYAAWYTDGLVDFRAKRKGDSLLER